MKSLNALLVSLACLSLTACANLYESHFQPIKPGMVLTPKAGAELVVVPLPMEEHSLAAQEQLTTHAMLGQSAFRSSSSVTARDLEKFSRKIGAERVLSSKRFIESRTNLVTRYHHLHGIEARGWVDGKYTNMRVDGIQIPYQAQEIEDVYEFRATFFQGKAQPPLPVP